MTMDEIEKLATELERHAQADVRTGRSPEDRHPARIAARAALLRAVEALELEAAKADSWRQAAEGFRRERDDLAGRFATETKERERCRDGWANERARADRAESALVARHGGEPLALLAELDEARDRADRLLSERDAASATAQRIAERLAAAESALAAMRKALALAYDLLRHLYTTGGGRYALHPDSPNPQTVIDAVFRALASPPPPAALSTETEALNR